MTERLDVVAVTRYVLLRDGAPVVDPDGLTAVFETAGDAWEASTKWNRHDPVRTYEGLRAMSDDEVAMRALVSARWAEDWDSPEDAAYDEDER